MLVGLGPAQRTDLPAVCPAPSRVGVERGGGRRRLRALLRRPAARRRGRRGGRVCLGRETDPLARQGRKASRAVRGALRSAGGVGFRRRTRRSVRPRRPGPLDRRGSPQARIRARTRARPHVGAQVVPSPPSGGPPAASVVRPGRQGAERRPALGVRGGKDRGRRRPGGSPRSARRRRADDRGDGCRVRSRAPRCGGVRGPGRGVGPDSVRSWPPLTVRALDAYNQAFDSDLTPEREERACTVSPDGSRQSW